MCVSDKSRPRLQVKCCLQASLPDFNENINMICLMVILCSPMLDTHSLLSIPEKGFPESILKKSIEILSC